FPCFSTSRYDTWPCAKAQGFSLAFIHSIPQTVPLRAATLPQLDREEIERILGLSELKEAKAYQEGEQADVLKGERSLVFRLLTRRLKYDLSYIESKRCERV
ncbi:MAG: hypothetical protein ACFCU8_17700, partial [Thermosynechococcaceae cyanobacterium]